MKEDSAKEKKKLEDAQKTLEDVMAEFQKLTSQYSQQSSSGGLTLTLGKKKK